MWGHNYISSAKHVEIQSPNDDIKDCNMRGTDSCNPLHLSITGDSTFPTIGTIGKQYNQRLFVIRDASVTLSWLRLDGGRLPFLDDRKDQACVKDVCGGLVQIHPSQAQQDPPFFYTHFEAEHVIFSNAQAGCGGAICQLKAEGQVMNEHVKAKHATQEASITLIDSTFVNNKATLGGAIFVQKWEDKMNDAGSNENVFGLQLKNVTFQENMALKEGGAIQLAGNNKLTFLNSDVAFISNSAVGRGNSLQANVPLILEVESTNFFSFAEGCAPGKKGAVNGPLTVDDDFVTCPSLCKAGKYSGDTYDVRTTDGCKYLCPAGGYCPQGSPQPTPCPGGKWGKSQGESIESDACLTCPAGYFTTGEVVASSCRACPTGWVQREERKPFCTECASGNYMNEEGSTSCNECPEGTFSSKQSIGELMSFGSYRVDNSAPLGYRMERGALASCEKCPAGRNTGTTVHNGGSSSNWWEVGIAAEVKCSTCPMGWYVSLSVGLSECVRYEMPTSQDDNKDTCKGKGGVWSAGMCQIRPGPPVCTTVPDKTTYGCSQCTAGRYTDKKDFILDLNKEVIITNEYGYDDVTYTKVFGCKMCQIGKESDDGASECTNCVAGQYNDGKGKVCDNCPDGWVQPEEGSSSCSKCDEGKKFTSTKAACTPCDIGKKGVMLVGMGTDLPGKCEDCFTNSYQKEEGKTTCVSCEVGMSYQTKTTPCQECESGKFGSEAGTCLNCKEGKFQENKKSTSCKECQLGQQFVSGSVPCRACELGRWGDTTGCHDCETGMYSDEEGKTSCRSCGVNTFGVNPKSVSSSECEKCEEGRTTGLIEGASAANACLCESPTFYADDKGDCVPCETGADCSTKNGLTLAELTAKPGYWRPSLDSNIFSPCVAGYSSLDAQNLANARCCPVDSITNISICARNMSGSSTTTSFALDDQCTEGFSGPLCLVCAKGFVKQGDGCVSCPQGASISIAALPLIGMLVSLFIGLLLFFMCGKKATKNAENAVDDGGFEWFGQAKIILSFLQIFSSMPGVMEGVPWPKPFLKFALPLGLANLDFLAVLAKTGCSLNVRFYDKFILHMILPVGCVLIIALAYILAKFCCIKKGHVEKEVQIKEIASKAMILIILCLYPGLST